MPTPVRVALSTYGKKTIRSDPSIYMKLSQGAPQRDWRRTKNTGPFEIEVFVLAARKPKSNLAGTRRATAPRIQEAARTIDSFLEQRSDLQPEGTELTVPETATFAQAQHIDAMREQETALEEPTHQTISVRFNGSTEMPLTIEVAELRRVLALPSHNLLASGVFSSFEPPAEPEEDVSDDEHKSD
ncbi:hypothetical protein PHYSODRAFT_308795 [Phytophthora sojae]|uniref:Uncharacterized protein n=1 Tax=Phytophthora sojae (strain P6497) TaxID=1094619 RepID=G4YFT0_PHYSP|nr:hypothetical protein PHYSODRAFT_308795 [Phytophthora sojae]EGZ27657.1 hypothetical protein PHYSODRAFT_308795 [Phytophthora sojae]|eukprot:XP_009514932.1 hypothetical protein PHYSODRAFT_308795 [Phytophthora sojae]